MDSKGWVDGRALHRTRDESDLMGRFAIELIEKTEADVDTGPAREQRHHAEMRGLVSPTVL